MGTVGYVGRASPTLAAAREIGGLAAFATPGRLPAGLRAVQTGPGSLYATSCGAMLLCVEMVRGLVPLVSFLVLVTVITGVPIIIGVLLKPS